MPSGAAAGTKCAAIQPRSSENTPSITAPNSVGRMTMRPAASHAARPEPTATATEKMVRNSVITASVPLRLTCTSGSSSDSTSAPTSQNQLTTMAPHHSRGSSRNSLIRSQVETMMLRLIVRLGAPSPVRRDQQARQPACAARSAASARRNGSDCCSPFAAMPARMVPSRMARKVPPSISALPAGNSVAGQMVGQDAVFDRAEQSRQRPEQKQRDEQQARSNERQSR